MSVRASIVHSSTVTVELPYGAELTTQNGDHELAMPLDGAVSMFWALRDLLREEAPERIASA